MPSQQDAQKEGGANQQPHPVIADDRTRPKESPDSLKRDRGAYYIMNKPSGSNINLGGHPGMSTDF